MLGRLGGVVCLWFACCGVAHAQNLMVSGECPDITVNVGAATPGGNLAVMLGRRPGTDALPGGPCAGTTTGLTSPSIITTGVANAAGGATFAVTVPDMACGKPVQVVDLATCGLSPVRRVPAVCAVDADCDDGNTCTVDTCRMGACMHDGRGVVDPCDDGNACTTGDTCAGDFAGTCEGGAALTCDDGVGCTVDACDPDVGCAYVPDDAACDDGLFCDGAEVCDPVAGCVTEPAPCGSDGVACTVDVCDEDLDLCLWTPDDAACDDGDACTTDVCDPVTDCANVLTCECFSDGDCDDGNPCTASTCDAGTCVDVPLDGAVCDDGDVCTTGDVCNAGTCTGGGLLSCDDGLACSVDTCDPATGCANTPTDALCDDGLFCNGEETCGAVGCETGVGVGCDDAIPCTLDYCNDGSDACDHVPDDAACDNGDPSDIEVCDPDVGCVTLAPSPEVCNGFDDDLNGLADDGIVCSYRLFTLEYPEGLCVDDDVTVLLDGVVIFEDDDNWTVCPSAPVEFAATPGQLLEIQAFDEVSGYSSLADVYIELVDTGATQLLTVGAPVASGGGGHFMFFNEVVPVPGAF